MGYYTFLINDIPETNAVSVIVIKDGKTKIIADIARVDVGDLVQDVLNGVSFGPIDH